MSCFFLQIESTGIITYINFTSVKLYVRINNVFSVCKLIVCIVVICIGIYQLAIGNTKNLDNPFEGSTRNPGFIALAFCNGLWAYDGWSSITTITEEIKAPEKYEISITITTQLLNYFLWKLKVKLDSVSQKYSTFNCDCGSNRYSHLCIYEFMYV